MKKVSEQAGSDGTQCKLSTQDPETGILGLPGRHSKTLSQITEQGDERGWEKIGVWGFSSAAEPAQHTGASVNP